MNEVHEVFVVISIIRMDESPPASASLLSVGEKSRAKMPLDKPVTMPTTELPFAWSNTFASFAPLPAAPMNCPCPSLEY